MDITTIRGKRRATGHATAQSLAITLAFHPDAARIGERAVLLDGGNRFSRAEPLFHGAGEPQPLATPFISRQPFVIHVGSALTIVPGDGGPIRIGGRIFAEPTEISLEQVAAGVVVEAGELAFVLHETLAGAPAPSMGLVGRSVGLERVRRQIERVAAHDVPVLVRGESGVGKELVARALHDRSPRASAPFVSVNMAAIPPATAASALFGHKRGAFTGADRDHGGFFGEAAGGTLFLDEIGETPDELQPTLLRALESGEIQPVGAARPRKSDCRLVAATDLALEMAVDEGRFRLPLLMRLSGYEIVVPPLRERRDDIPVLLLHFMREELRRIDAEGLLAAPAAGAESWLPRWVVVQALTARWEGNVRELKNAVRQLVVDNIDEDQILHGGALERQTGSRERRKERVEAPPVPSSPISVPRNLDEIGEKELVLALENNGYRPLDAARALGISKTSVYAVMRRLGVPTSSDLDVPTIIEAVEAARGDLSEAARGLRISPRALKLRMRTLGID
jgi:two-component system, NtrC family, nitrogen regulation response regulator GlnG